MTRIRATKIRPAAGAAGPGLPPAASLAANEYAFVNRWRLPATIEEVADILDEPSGFGRWWPAAWLDYRLVDAGGADGIGRRFRYRVKGWLPYSLNLEFTIASINSPYGFEVDAIGDLVGHGRWTLAQQGPKASVAYEWRVRAEYPLVRVLSPLFKPVFRSNHFWVMRQGAHSMFLEVLRRRATTPEELAAIPEPPGPVPPAAVGRDRFLRWPDIWDDPEPRDPERRKRSESNT